MKLPFPLVMAVAFFLSAESRSDDVKKEREKWQGTWIGQSAEADGENLPESQAKSKKLVVTGDNYIYTMGDVKEEGTIKLDPSKSPKEYASQITEGENKGKSVLGVYELQGDTLTICFSFPGSTERPTQMGTKPGSRTRRTTYKRVP